MPADKKVSPRFRQPSSQTSEKKSDRATRQPESETKHPTEGRSKATTTPKQEPAVASRPAMPMPVAPHRLPGKKNTAPLIKTTYNATRLRQLGILFAIVAIFGVGAGAWIFRGNIVDSLDTKRQGGAESKPFHLTIAPTPTPDAGKLAEINDRWRAQSSSSGQPVDYLATSSAALVTQLSASNPSQLQFQLTSYIEKLSTEGVNVANLEAYQQKVASLQASGDNKAAQQWLVEAVLHAHELELLHSYHQP